MGYKILSFELLVLLIACLALKHSASHQKLKLKI